MAPSLKFSVLGLTGVFAVGVLVSVLKNKTAVVNKSPVTRVKEPVVIPYRYKPFYTDTPASKNKAVLTKKMML